MARFLTFERDEEREQNGSTAYLLYDENHFAKRDDVAAKSQKLSQEGVSEEVYDAAASSRPIERIFTRVMRSSSSRSAYVSS